MYSIWIEKDNSVSSFRANKVTKSQKKNGNILPIPQILYLENTNDAGVAANEKNGEIDRK